MISWKGKMNDEGSRYAMQNLKMETVAFREFSQLETLTRYRDVRIDIGLDLITITNLLHLRKYQSREFFRRC